MLFLIAVLILLAGAAFLLSRKHGEDKLALRHIISVNLSILKSELDDLRKVADESASSADTDRAKSLLSSAAETALAVESRLKTASLKELGVMLEQVFRAMSQSTDARRLLGACLDISQLPVV